MGLKQFHLIFCLLLFSVMANGQTSRSFLDLFDNVGLFDRFNFGQHRGRPRTTALPSIQGALTLPSIAILPPLVGSKTPNITDALAQCPSKPICPSSEQLKYYRPDGTCNNPLDGFRGAVNHPFKRLLPAAYFDGKGQPRRAKDGLPLPSARVISTTMQDSIRQTSRRLSQMLPFWGQFIDHDLTNTPTTSRTDVPVNCSCGSTDPACYNIPIGMNDVQFIQEGKTCFPVVRSQPVPDINCDGSVRQQRNTLTGVIDAGNVYAGSQEHFDDLIDSNSTIGELKTANLAPHGIPTNPHPPILPVGSQVNASFARFMACPRAVHKPVNVPCFVAGDERANENSVLTTVHTMFVRYHNQVIRELHRLNPRWTKERLVQTTRFILAAVQQRVTYQQFLPVVLGRTFMKRFRLNLLGTGYSYAYDATYDTSVANAFGAAAYRFGHSLLPESMPRHSPQWVRIGTNLLLRNSFFNANPLLRSTNGGTESLVRGVVFDRSLQFNPTFANDVRNFLFAPRGRLGSDLPSINIQRGREHGVPGYNAYRELAGLKKAATWNDFVEIPPERLNKLQRLYGHVDDVDLFVGGISERSVQGGVVGPTFAYVIAHQFRDTKQGDRFWHENGGDKPLFSKGQLRAIRKVTFARIICDTVGGTQTIQPNPFLQPSVVGNRRKPCNQFPALDLSQWAENRVHADVSEKSSLETTVWFPMTLESGTSLDSVEILEYLLLYRPDDVCRNVVESETRTVGGKLQIRFKCPPGTIRGSDYPPSDVKNGVWTEWLDNSTPYSPLLDDNEARPANLKCERPLAIQAQSTRGVPARETGNVFLKFSVIDGLVCRGQDQPNGVCYDYRVRYLCKVSKPVVPATTTSYSIHTTPTTPLATTAMPYKTVWTAWTNNDNPIYNGGEFEFKYLVASSKGFCNNPIRIEARTVVGHKPAESTGDIFQSLSPGVGLVCYNGFHQLKYFCKDYEVRYLCPVTDLNP